MTVSECRQRGGVYLHVMADDLDGLLEAQLGTPPPSQWVGGAVSLTGLPHPKKTQAFAHAPLPGFLGKEYKSPGPSPGALFRQFPSEEFSRFFPHSGYFFF